MITRAPWQIRFWHWLVGCPVEALDPIGNWGMMTRCRSCRRVHWEV